MKTKFTLITVLLVFMSACATTKGYDYKSHHKRSANAKPSKCFKKHNSNW